LAWNGQEIGMTESREWPTGEEIRNIATNQRVALSAEAYDIAHQYHRISDALAINQLGDEDLNWCGFAQWSSKAVGTELRLDNHSGFLRKLGRRYYIPMAAEPLFRLFVLALLGNSYGAGLSIANRSIFVEMASFHTQFLSGADTPEIIQVTESGLYPHLLQHLGSEGLEILKESGHNLSLLEDLKEEGQDLLRTAYNLLSEARSTSGKRRSELILGANIALSAYEQKRVQPALEFVFYRPVRFAIQTSWRMPYYYIRRTMYERFRYYLRQHQDQPQLVQLVENFWVRMYSKTLWLKTAVTTVALGQPLLLPPRYDPPQLLRAASTFESEDVARLVQRYGPANPAQLKGVSDWLDYDERMRFIVAYFMTYQQIKQMFDEPRFKRPRPRPGRYLGNPKFHTLKFGPKASQA
jgi:hypothetical protein